jgi:hypothetical protein
MPVELALRRKPLKLLDLPNEILIHILVRATEFRLEVGQRQKRLAHMRAIFAIWYTYDMSTHLYSSPATLPAANTDNAFGRDGTLLVTSG